MKRLWNRQKAIDCLLAAGFEKPSENVMVKKGSLNGLKACSAMDYLTNHEKMYVILIGGARQ